MIKLKNKKSYSKAELFPLLEEIDRLTNDRDAWKHHAKAFHRKLNAAISDMELIAEGNLCFYCKYGTDSCEKKYSLHACSRFEWRGVQEKGGKDVNS